MLEIKNTLRSKSTIRITGNTATTINLTQLSVNTTTEIVSAASIAMAFATGSGYWKVYRGDNATGNVILDLYQNANLPLIDYDIPISTNSTSNVYVTNSGTDGTLILIMSKEATYSPALIGM